MKGGSVLVPTRFGPICKLLFSICKKSEDIVALFLALIFRIIVLNCLEVPGGSAPERSLQYLGTVKVCFDTDSFPYTIMYFDIEGEWHG